jgi:hypothetical protein
MIRRLWICVSAASLVLAGCGGDSDDGTATTPTSQEDRGVVAQVASYELVVGREQRFLVGLFSDEEGMVSHGAAELAFSFLGEEGNMLDEPTPGPDATAPFVPVPGSPESADSESAAFTSPSEARGVYGADAVRFDEAGFWEVAVDIEIDGKQHSATAAFKVLEESNVPVPGDPAPRTQNLLPGDPDAPPEAVDSRAEDDGTVPDPELHEETVAAAIDAGRPVMVVISTPVYCVSRFCGPITDTVQDLAHEYGDRMDFVHLEVFKDFEANTLNKAAVEWIWPDRQGEPAEPWVFLVDAGGTVIERWDNVASERSLTEAVKAVVEGTA